MEKNSDLVSVLIPVYNNSKYLRKCLDTVVNQTYKELQIVIVNDGSTDDSQTIIDEYASKYQNIESYYQENKGVSHARNNLLAHIKGKYSLFIDSDDWIEHNMVEFLTEAIKKTDTDIAVCSILNNNNVDDTLKIEIWKQEKIIYEFLNRTRFNGILWNKLIKSSLFDGCSFDCNVYISEDDLFFWQIIQKNPTLVLTNKKLYYYRLNEDGICMSKWDINKRGTIRTVWSSILKDVEKYWSHYIDIVEAHLVKLDAEALIQASLSDYEYDEHIEARQNNVKQNIYRIEKDLPFKHLIVAKLLSHWYGFGRYLRLLPRKINNT